MIKEGTTVQWEWGTGMARGTVVESFDRQITKELQGTAVTRYGKEGDRALLIEQDNGNQFLRLESEVEVAD